MHKKTQRRSHARIMGVNDFDSDGDCGDVDNCPTAANPDQATRRDPRSADLLRRIGLGS